VPHLFRHRTDPLEFYDIPEKDLSRMARAHYGGSIHILSPFSSWAASLHLVLFYARSMRSDRQPHVAVMDTENLEDRALVWHCPDLGRFQNHEYLAYGRIRGSGYRAVSLEDLETHGIFRLFPELQYPSRIDDGFGTALREAMFSRQAEPLTEEALDIAENLANIYGPLFLPVYVALLCLEPRPWYTTVDSGICEDQQIIKRLLSVLDRTEFDPKLAELVGQEWLKVGKVRTSEFLDVKQWVGLLSALVEADLYRPVAFNTRGQGIKKRNRLEDDVLSPGVRRFGVAINAFVNIWSRRKGRKSDR
jgi:hypothetical protein